MPLIHGFQGTTIGKAFLINAIATSVVIVVGIYIKAKTDILIGTDGKEIDNTPDFNTVVTTFYVTTAAAFISYLFMYYTFCYGGGMIAPHKLTKQERELFLGVKV